MLIGVMLFANVSSSITEATLVQSIDIYKNNTNIEMINKISNKYSLTGDSVRFLSLLGDSVSTVALENEVEFIDLMPGFMRETIFKQIFEVYKNKFNFFNDEQLHFFV